VLTHTEAPEQFSGQGHGSKLAAGVFRLIRESGRRVAIQCPFMAGWASRHPEVKDFIVS
jgi:predicted GNAT family acetyltransferase